MWLLVDDMRNLNTEFVARSYNEGTRLIGINKEKINHLCIDHDLGEGKSGYDFILYCIDKNYLPTHVQIVSDNPVGVKNIGDALKSEGYKTIDWRNYYKCR